MAQEQQARPLLLLALAANQDVLFEAVLFAEAVDTGDVKIAWTVSVGAALVWGATATDVSASAYVGSAYTNYPVTPEPQPATAEGSSW